MTTVETTHPATDTVILDKPETSAPVSEEFAAKQAEADDILDSLMARIGDPTTGAAPKVQVYGRPGVGKTVFGGQAEGVLVVDVDRGALSLLNHQVTRNVKTLEYRSVFQVRQLAKYLKEGHPKLDWVKVVFLDTFSELVKKDLDSTPQVTIKGDTAPDWSTNYDNMRKLADDLRSSGRSIIFSAHVREEKDSTTGALLVRPDYTPKIANSLIGMFDLVGWMQNKDGVRTLQCHPTPNVTAKTRIGGLPVIMENPKFSQIQEAFNKMVKGE